MSSIEKSGSASGGRRPSGSWTNRHERPLLPTDRELRVLANRQYETMVVRYLLTRYRLTAARKEIQSRHADMEGWDGVSLLAFYDRFPDFPVRFEVYHRDASYALPKKLGKLMEKFGLLGVVESLQELSQEHLGASCGLLLPIERAVDKFGMVLHNHPVPVEAAGVRLVATDFQGAKLTLETFQSLLSTIRWTPDGHV